MSKPPTDGNDQRRFDPTDSTTRTTRRTLLPSSNFGLVILAVAILSAFSHMVAVMYLGSVPVLESNPLYKDIFSQAELETGKQVARQITALAIGGYLFTLVFATLLGIRGIIQRYV